MKKLGRPRKRVPWISPTLWVEDVKAAAALYERAFDFEGKVFDGGWAELRHHRGRVMLGQSPWKPLATPGALGGSSVNVFVYVSDVDALAIRAARAGCTVLGPPQDMPFGDRCVRIVDPYGHCWMFATHIDEPRDTDVPPPFKGE